MWHRRRHGLVSVSAQSTCAAAHCRRCPIHLKTARESGWWKKMYTRITQITHMIIRGDRSYRHFLKIVSNQIFNHKLEDLNKERIPQQRVHQENWRQREMEGHDRRCLQQTLHRMMMMMCLKTLNKPMHQWRHLVVMWSLARPMCTTSSSPWGIAQSWWWCRGSWSACPAQWCCPRSCQTASWCMGCPFGSLYPRPVKRERKVEIPWLWTHIMVSSHHDQVLNSVRVAGILETYTFMSR